MSWTIYESELSQTTVAERNGRISFRVWFDRRIHRAGWSLSAWKIREHGTMSKWIAGKIIERAKEKKER